MSKKEALKPAAFAPATAACTAARGRVGDMRPTVQKKCMGLPDAGGGEAAYCRVMFCRNVIYVLVNLAHKRL